MKISYSCSEKHYISRRQLYKMHPKTLCTCRHLHGFHTSPQQTDHRILLGRQQTRSSESSSPIRSCRASLNAARQGAGQAVLMFSAAIWLTLQGPAAHAEDATVASFNKNCIGDQQGEIAGQYPHAVHDPHPGMCRAQAATLAAGMLCRPGKRYSRATLRGMA